MSVMNQGLMSGVPLDGAGAVILEIFVGLFYSYLFTLNKIILIS